MDAGAPGGGARPAPSGAPRAGGPSCGRVPDPVADALARLQRREPAAVALFRAAADAVVARLGELAGDRESLAQLAIESALAAPAELTSLEQAASRGVLRAAAAQVRKRELAAALADGAAVQSDRAFYAKICDLPELSRSILRSIFVKRTEFAEFVTECKLNGPQLSAVLTTIRQVVSAGAELPPPPDTPAYVRIPFLVTGKLSPEDAARVRDHLGGSAPCRAAYRDLDLLDRMLTRVGPASTGDHPDVTQLLGLADGLAATAEVRDGVAEHVRICGGCDAMLKTFRASSKRQAADTLAGQMDEPVMRRRLAVIAAVLSVVIPLGAHVTFRGSNRWLEVGRAEGVDLGLPLREDPGRSATVLSLRDPGVPIPVSLVLPIEEQIAFDARLSRADGSELDAMGGIPFERVGGGKGRVSLLLRSEQLTPGAYQLHVLRRFLGAGGEPADLVYPIEIRPRQ